MTWDLRIGGVKLGNATLQDVILNPGSNIIPARGVLDVKLALKHLRKIIASEKAALKKGNLPISATGNTMVYNGQHIDYYEKNLKKFTLTAPLSIVSVLVDTLKGLKSPKLHSGSSLSNRSSILPLLPSKRKLV
jgi:hypothetical protein